MISIARHLIMVLYRLLVQIHDELLLEVHETQLSTVAGLTQLIAI